MTEEDLEDIKMQPGMLYPEIVRKNELATIIKDSDLPADKSKVLMAKFANFFSDADLWAKKAKAIKVTNESQKVIMEQARQGRLFLRKIRLEIENLRKSLKEESLREGRAIDKVAKILKEQIEPIEEYLDKQEHFVEYREAEKEALVRAEVERKLEEERLAEEKRKAEELENTRRENERLRKEAEEKERINKQELERVRKENEKILEAERERTRKAEEEIRLKKQAELKAEAEVQRKAMLLKSANDVVKIQKFLDDIMAIQFPECTSIEAKRIVMDAQNHIGIVELSVKKYIKSKQTEEEL